MTLLGRTLAIERGRSSDDLDDIRAQRGGELVCRVFHAHGGILGELNLHQFARTKRVVDRLAEGIGNAVLAEVHGRGEMMRLSTKFGAPLGRKSHQLQGLGSRV